MGSNPAVPTNVSKRGANSSAASPLRIASELSSCMPGEREPLLHALALERANRPYWNAESGNPNRFPAPLFIAAACPLIRGRIRAK